MELSSTCLTRRHDTATSLPVARGLGPDAPPCASTNSPLMAPLIVTLNWPINLQKNHRRCPPGLGQSKAGLPDPPDIRRESREVDTGICTTSTGIGLRSSQGIGSAVPFRRHSVAVGESRRRLVRSIAISDRGRSRCSKSHRERHRPGRRRRAGHDPDRGTRVRIPCRLQETSGGIRLPRSVRTASLFGGACLRGRRCRAADDAASGRATERQPRCARFASMRAVDFARARIGRPGFSDCGIRRIQGRQDGNTASRIVSSLGATTPGRRRGCQVRDDPILHASRLSGQIRAPVGFRLESGQLKDLAVRLHRSVLQRSAVGLHRSVSENTMIPPVDYRRDSWCFDLTVIGHRQVVSVRRSAC